MDEVKNSVSSEDLAVYGPTLTQVDELEAAESQTDAGAECSGTPAEEKGAVSNTADDSSEKAEDKAGRKKRLGRGFAMAAFLAAAAIVSLFSFGSEGKYISDTSGSLNFVSDLAASVRQAESASLGTVYNLPKVYILPWNQEPAPVPRKDCYTSAVDENGTEITTYEDETITVKYWKERRMDSNVHFAEVWIAHPTQLRTLLAGSVSGFERSTPQKLAQKANAVVAINADYCGYRTGGIIIRQGTTYRSSPFGWDILLIDSEGDFHIMCDWYVQRSKVLEEYNIVNTLEFGPSLIIDGEINTSNMESGCGKNWNRKDSPRTGIGQIGRLHYLLCCVEGRTDDSAGVHTDEIAELMFEKGCVQAYNLDGGMSTTMVLDGEAMNTPMWGGQRVVTDIVYFATGLPSEE